MSALTWNGDPSILVYAARWALTHGTGSHAGHLVAATIWANHRQLPAPARHLLVREITCWLDGRGLAAGPDERRPWVDALDMLGGPARPITVPEQPHIPTQRRRADHRLPARQETVA